MTLTSKAVTDAEEHYRFLVPFFKNQCELKGILTPSLSFLGNSIWNRSTLVIQLQNNRCTKNQIILHNLIFLMSIFYKNRNKDLFFLFFLEQLAMDWFYPWAGQPARIGWNMQIQYKSSTEIRKSSKLRPCPSCAGYFQPPHDATWFMMLSPSASASCRFLPPSLCKSYSSSPMGHWGVLKDYSLRSGILRNCSIWGSFFKLHPPPSTRCPQCPPWAAEESYKIAFSALSLTLPSEEVS